MNFFSFLLTIHLVGAGITGIVCVYAVYVLTQSILTRFPSLIKTLSALSVAQVSSGAALSIVGEQSITTFCSQILVYFIIIIGIQAILYVKLAVLPTRLLVIPHTLNLLITVLTLVFLGQ